MTIIIANGKVKIEYITDEELSKTYEKIVMGLYGSNSNSFIFKDGDKYNLNRSNIMLKNSL